MSLAFQIKDIAFDYDGISAIRNLSLEVARGERIALLGANGSGKSTLLKILDGLYSPSGGSVVFDGQPLSQEQQEEDGFWLSFRRRVALVFQNPDVQLFNPTVFEEVAYAPLQLGWKQEEIVRGVEEALRFMAISDLRDRVPYRLSSGEKKRVAIASVLVLDPDVLLLDEPTAMLDPRSQSQIIDLLQQWKGSAKTVITATHQIEIVEDIADRVLVMEAGTVTAQGTPREILANHELLLRANLVHAHRHSHGSVVHSHPHLHGHAHHDHDHEHHE